MLQNELDEIQIWFFKLLLKSLKSFEVITTWWNEICWDPHNSNWLAIKLRDCVLDHQALKELEAKILRNLIKNA